MKHLFILCLLLLQIKAHSQSLSGEIQVGGAGSFFIDQINQNYMVNSALVQDVFKIRTISIIPQIGYFVNDNISIGGRIGYSNVKTERLWSSDGITVVDNESESGVFNIGPYVRFHKSLNEQLFLFVQGNLDVGFGTIKNGRTDPTIDENIFEVEAGLRPGILLLLSKKVGIESTFGFLGYKLTQTKLKDTNISPTPTNKDQNYGLDLNLRTFNIGVQFYL